MTDKQEKILQIHELIMDVDDVLVSQFFDLESEEMLDTKINVLTQLKNGVPPIEIPEYYSILELYPEDGQMWD